jgi:hypothetical protein
MRLVKFSCHVTRHHTPYFTINQQLGIIFPVHPRVVQAHFRHLTAPSRASGTLEMPYLGFE